MQAWGKRNNRRSFKKLPLFIAVLSSLYGLPALAQEQPQETQDQAAALDQARPTAQEQAEPTASAQEATELDTIVVTGTLLNRPEYESTSPVQVI